MPFEQSEIDAFFGHSSDPDEHHEITYLAQSLDPAVALAETVELARLAPDDDGLCWLGVVVLEAVLDLHWEILGDAVDRALGSEPQLRKALSCAWINEVPDELAERWYATIRPDEQVGRRES